MLRVIERSCPPLVVACGCFIIERSCPPLVVVCGCLSGVALRLWLLVVA